MFFAVLFILSRSSPPWEMRRIWEAFVVWKLFLPLERFLSTSGSFYSSIIALIEDSPKLPWGMQRIRGPFGSFCFKDHHYESFRLSRDSLSCATRSLALYILLKFIFLYLWYIPLLSCTFHTFCFHQFFHMYQYRSPCEIFLLSLMIALIGESSEFNFKF